MNGTMCNGRASHDSKNNTVAETQLLDANDKSYKLNESHHNQLIFTAALFAKPLVKRSIRYHKLYRLHCESRIRSTNIHAHRMF